MSKRKSSLDVFGEAIADAAKGRRVHAKTFKGTESRTKQAFRDGTRVDNVLRRYATAGVDAAFAPHLFAQSVASKPFGVDPGKDYHQQLSAVTAVRQYFEGLPSKLRARFGNDPGQLVNFLNDPANLEEAVKLGLVVKPEHKDPAPEAAPNKPAEVPPPATDPKPPA